MKPSRFIGKLHLSRCCPTSRRRCRSDRVSSLRDAEAGNVIDHDAQVAFGPIEHDFSKARTVVGTYRPAANAGKSLILQGHCDVVPAGPLEMWETPPFSPTIKDGRIARTFHMENWLSALGQLRAK